MPTRLAGWLLIVALVPGCSSTLDGKVDLKIRALSTPDKCEVHCRRVELEREQTVPERSGWEYVGLTILDGKVSLPKDFMERDTNALELMVTKKGYHAEFRTIRVPEIDPNGGVAISVNLRSLDAPRESTKP